MVALGEGAEDFVAKVASLAGHVEGDDREA